MADVTTTEKIKVKVEAEGIDKAQKSTKELEKALKEVQKAAKTSGEALDKAVSSNVKENKTAEALSKNKAAADQLSASAKKLAESLAKVYSTKQIKNAEAIGTMFRAFNGNFKGNTSAGMKKLQALTQKPTQGGLADAFKKLPSSQQSAFAGYMRSLTSEREAQAKASEKEAAAQTKASEKVAAAKGKEAAAQAKAESRKRSEMAKTLQMLGKAVSGAVGGAGKAVGKGAFNIAKFVSVEPIKRAAANFGKFAQKYNKFVSSIGRIAVYRAIRAALKEITQALQEGVNNLYLWAQASGNSFTASMDSMATSFLYLKNSVGAAVSPILDLLAPAINTATNAIVRMFNAVNQLAAVLTGSSTWRRAIKVQTTYAEANNLTAKSASGASKAVKDYENTVLGFDELNKLNGVNDSGGGTSSATDYSGMFEQVAVENAFKQTAYEIGQSFAEHINKALDLDWDSIQNKFKQASSKLQSGLMGLINGLNWAKLGSTFSKGFNTILAFGNSFVRGMEWKTLGRNLGEGVNGAVSDLDWSEAGFSFVSGFKIALETLHGFLNTFDWGAFRVGIVKGVEGAFSGIDWSNAVKDIVRLIGEITATLATLGTAILKGITSAIASTDWAEVGRIAYKYLISVDWNSVISSTFEFIGATVGALAGIIGGFFEELGSFVSEGFLGGILDGLKSISEWIMQNVVNPLVDGFKAALGIHSPSTVMREIGSFTIAGFYEGLASGWKSISQWMSDKLSEIKNWASKLVKSVSNAFDSSYSSGKSFSGGTSSWSGGGIKGFANGGFPSSGSLFLAGEAGAEYVGNVGGRTGVVNDAGLSGAVAQGNQAVVNAMVIAAESIVGAINSKDTNAYLDSRLVSQALYKANAQTAMAHGGSLIRR